MTGTRAFREAALRSCRYLLVLTLLASAVNLAMAATALAVPVPAAGTAAAHGWSACAAGTDAEDGHAAQSPDRNETRIVKKVKGFAVSLFPQRPTSPGVPPAVCAVPAPAGTHLPSPVARGAGNRRGPPGPARTHASES